MQPVFCCKAASNTAEVLRHFTLLVMHVATATMIPSYSMNCCGFAGAEGQQLHRALQQSCLAGTTCLHPVA